MSKKLYKMRDFYQGIAMVLLLALLFSLMHRTFSHVNKMPTKKQVTINCEKPCCHVFFNRYCSDCKEYRDRENE